MAHLESRLLVHLESHYHRASFVVSCCVCFPFVVSCCVCVCLRESEFWECEPRFRPISESFSVDTVTDRSLCSIHNTPQHTPTHPTAKQGVGIYGTHCRGGARGGAVAGTGPQ